MGRVIRTAFVAVAAALALAGAVYAHGGTVVATASNDAYKLTVQAIDMRLQGRPAVDLTAYPVRRTNGAPDLDAAVTFKLGTQVATGRRQADGITAEIPIEKTGSWRYEPITVTVNGAAGVITVNADALSEPDDGPPVALVPGTIVVVLALIAVAIIRRRGRDEDAPLQATG
jgi:hypothetical protein